MSVFGVSAGTIQADFPKANEPTVTKITVPQSHDLTTLTAISAKAQTGLNVKACIYSHNSGTGRPGSLLATSAVRTSIPGGPFDLTFPSTSLTAGTYWIGLHADTTILSSDSVEGGETYTVSQPYGSGLPATWPTTTTLSTTSRPIFGLWRGTGVEVSKINTYAVLIERIFDPIKISQSFGYAVVQDKFIYLTEIREAHGYAAFEGPRIGPRINKAVGYVVLDQEPTAVSIHVTT